VQVATCAATALQLVRDFPVLVQGGACDLLVVVGVNSIVAEGGRLFLSRFLSPFCFSHISFEKFKVRIL